MPGNKLTSYKLLLFGWPDLSFPIEKVSGYRTVLFHILCKILRDRLHCLCLREARSSHFWSCISSPPSLTCILKNWSVLLDQWCKKQYMKEFHLALSLIPLPITIKYVCILELFKYVLVGASLPWQCDVIRCDSKRFCDTRGSIH